MTLVGDGLTRDRRGFSLLEVTLALAIVGVLLTALLPVATGGQESAKLTATLHTAAGLAQAVRQYREATGAWPTAWTDLSGRFLATASPTTAWGGGFTLTATPSYAEIRTRLPLSGLASGLLPAVASLAPVPGGTELSIRVPLPGETADLELERKRLTGS